MQNLFLSRASLYRADNCRRISARRYFTLEGALYIHHFASPLCPFWAILPVLMQHHCCTWNRESNIGKNLLICSILDQCWLNDEKLNSYNWATLSLFSECHRWRSKSISSKNLYICCVSSGLKIGPGQKIPYIVTVDMCVLLSNYVWALIRGPCLNTHLWYGS